MLKKILLNKIKFFFSIKNFKDEKALRKFKRKTKLLPFELDDSERKLIYEIREKNLSMCSYERLAATAMACKYICKNNKKAIFVECGVWRGGNGIIAATIFKKYKIPYKIYLFDTFKGMTKPTKEDKKINGNQLALKFYNIYKRRTHNDWCYAAIEEVKDNFKKYGLFNKNIFFIEGDITKTLKQLNNIPNIISILRIDTNWYKSTKIILEKLYPKLKIGGILLSNDYAYWSGSKKAIDDYFHKKSNQPYFQYVDQSGRTAIKFK